MYNQSVLSFTIKLSALAMMFLLMSVNFVSQLPFENNVITAEQAEENTDWLEDDCLVNTVTLSIYNVKGIQTKFTYSYSNSLYSQPYYSIVYPPPEFLISM